MGDSTHDGYAVIMIWGLQTDEISLHRHSPCTHPRSQNGNHISFQRDGPKAENPSLDSNVPSACFPRRTPGPYSSFQALEFLAKLTLFHIFPDKCTWPPNWLPSKNHRVRTLFVGLWLSTSLKAKGIKGPSLQGLSRWEVENSGIRVLGAGGGTPMWVPVAMVSPSWPFPSKGLLLATAQVGLLPAFPDCLQKAKLPMSETLDFKTFSILGLPWWTSD